MADLPGSAGDDSILGGAGDDHIEGLAGRDTLDGAAGNDTIAGGEGLDSVLGGEGNDVFEAPYALGDTVSGGAGWDRVVGLDLSASAERVHIDTRSLLVLLHGNAYTGPQLQIEGVEQFSGLRGGSADDYFGLGFAGDTFPTLFRGGAGNDYIALDFSAANGEGHLASRVALGPMGVDVATLAVRLDDGSWLADVSLDNDIEHYDITGSAGNDLLNGFTANDTLRGGGGRDALYGRGGEDSLVGGPGADRLNGGIGDDQLLGGTGADSLDGGLGSDIAVYFGASRGVSVDLALGQGAAGDAQGDVLRGIEGIVGTNGNDRLLGDEGANRLHASYGADRIFGRGGDDFITGDTGPVFPVMPRMTTATSWFYGGDGNDEIWGATQLTSTLDALYYQPTIIHGGSGDDRLYNGLAMYGEAGDDYLSGGAINSTLDGGAGNDEIEATYGDHVVFGGSGRDFVWTEALHGGTNTVDLGAGDDVGLVGSYDPLFAHVFDGGEGTDGFVFATDNVSLSTVVRIDIADQAGGVFQPLGTVTITNFERLSLLLAGDHDDDIRLGNSTDFVRAGEGNDYLAGRGGADFLDGHYGVDSIVGGGGNDVVIAGSSPAGRVEIARGGNGDDVVYGNFSSADYAGVAELYGEAGRDVFAFLPAGIYTPDRVMDFDPAEDYVALYDGPYYYVDPTSHTFNRILPIEVSDTAAELRFTFMDRVNDYDIHLIEAVYDRSSGELRVRDTESSGDEGRLVCTLTGAPDIGIDNFLTLPEVALQGEGAGAYYDVALQWAQPGTHALLIV